MTVAQLLQSSFRLVMGNETADANDLANGLLALNTLLNNWSVKRWGTFTVTQETFTLTASDGVYSIGSGGDINTVRPIRLLEGCFIRSNDTDYPLDVVTREKYNSRSFKTLTGIPFDIYYEPSFPLGQISLYPEPDSAYVLHLNSQKALTAYTSTASSLNLPPEYEAALKFNVALDWANELGVEPSNLVVAKARETLGDLKTLHHTVPQISAKPFAVTGRDYDINGDVYYGN